MAKCVCTACVCRNRGLSSLDGYCHDCDEGHHHGRVGRVMSRFNQVAPTAPAVIEDRRCGDHPDYSMYLTNEEAGFFYHCVFCSCKYPA